MTPAEGEPQSIHSLCQKDAWGFNNHTEAFHPTCLWAV